MWGQTAIDRRVDKVLQDNVLSTLNLHCGDAAAVLMLERRLTGMKPGGSERYEV